MKKLLFVLSMLLFFVIAQQGLAGDAIFDDSSKTLTISNVKFENDPSLYNVKLQLKSDGDLSILDIDNNSIQNSQEDDNSDFLYDLNPDLVRYQMTESLPITESTKWDKENFIGVYSNGFHEFTFNENGTGMINCPNDEMGINRICNIGSFEWTIDHYGNLVFGALRSDYSIENDYYRFIWTIVSSDGENNSITVYEQIFSMKHIAVMFQEGIATYTIIKE